LDRDPRGATWTSSRRADKAALKRRPPDKSQGRTRSVQRERSPALSPMPKQQARAECAREGDGPNAEGRRGCKGPKAAKAEKRRQGPMRDYQQRRYSRRRCLQWKQYLDYPVGTTTITGADTSAAPAPPPPPPNTSTPLGDGSSGMYTGGPRVPMAARPHGALATPASASRRAPPKK